MSTNSIPVTSAACHGQTVTADSAGMVRRRPSTDHTDLGTRKTSFMLDDETRNAIQELQDEWDFKTQSEAVGVALKFLQHATRTGLRRINLE